MALDAVKVPVHRFSDHQDQYTTRGQGVRGWGLGVGVEKTGVRGWGPGWKQKDIRNPVGVGCNPARTPIPYPFYPFLSF